MEWRTAMTDITELAQREKFEAWFKSSFHPDKTGPYIKDQLYFAWKAAGAELVEALENSESRLHEVAVACATAEQALEKAQQQTTESENRVRKQNRHICELFDDNTALRQRIAELESRTVNVKLPTTIEPTAFSPWVAKAFYQFHKDTVKSCFAVFSDACAAAGIKVEAE